MAKITVNERLNSIIESSQGKTYLVAAVTLLVIVLMIFLAIAPAYRSITDQLTLNQFKAQYLADLNTKNSNLQTLATQEQKYTGQLSLLDSYLPAKDNTELVTANLNKISETYGCKLSLVNFGTKGVSANGKLPAGAYPSLVAIPLNVSLNCTPDQLPLFLQHLESLPIVIYSKTITYFYKSGDSSIYTFSLTGEYYFWNTETAP
jgi:Tfp pilus assembly protein PilO